MHQAPQGQLVIPDCAMLREAVIPHQQVANLPAMRIERLRPNDVLKQSR
jgi:hypothetical protein